jgi:hypothetical protein
MRHAAFRQPVASSAQRKAKPKTFPAPIRGWVLNENLATVGGASARVLDNWFPTTQGIRVRGGSFKHATLDDKVLSMWTYKNGATETFFAATETKVYDITSPADADTIPTAAIIGQSDGYYSAQQFGTAGGEYLYICNDDSADYPYVFDGSSWAQVTTVSTIAITGVDPRLLSQTWSYASRLFFVESGTLDAWYLPTDSIGGAANQFSLSGIVKRGGYLVFGGSWSLGAGDGLSDKCVFVTSEGEVAVYSGTNPASASTWVLDNVYRIGRPLGKNCVMRAGGDLLICTEQGLVPLSAAIRLGKDYAALSMAAISAPIEPEWEAQVAKRQTLPWEVLKISSKSMGIVSQPRISDDIPAQCFAFNLETGAWAKFDQWDVRCTGLYDGLGYFGSNDACVYLMESGGSDAGTPYTAKYAANPDHCGSIGFTKTFQQARAMFLATHPFTPQISAGVDYQYDFPAAPSAVADYSSSQWDSGLWDVATWDGGSVQEVKNTRMVSIGRTGETVLPQIQITFGTTPTPNVQLVSYLLTYTGGSFVP